MSVWEDLAAGVRAGTVPAEVVSRWLLAQPQLWFVVEGEFDEAGRPQNVRPLIVHHPSGATVSLLFTDEARAQRYRASRDDLTEPLGVVGVPPVVSFETLLQLPIDGITINPGDPSRLNAGRRQLEGLAAAARANTPSRDASR